MLQALYHVSKLLKKTTWQAWICTLSTVRKIRLTSENGEIVDGTILFLEYVPVRRAR